MFVCIGLVTCSACLLPKESWDRAPADPRVPLTQEQAGMDATFKLKSFYSLNIGVSALVMINYAESATDILPSIYA